MNLRLLFPALLLAALFAGCTGQAADDLDPNRGPLGKADAFGSCENSGCDGISVDGNCWCDEQCAFYGDCCADKVDVCDAPAQKSCGGFTIEPQTCDAGEYCHYEQGDFCGAADAPGVCMDVPEACIEIFAPVCGCDGETYPNSCFANMAGTSVAHDGECTPPLCMSDNDCSAGETCDTSVCHTPCAPGQVCPQVCWGECTTEPAPQQCGGFANLPCPDDKVCVDDPNDSCDPENGGADCGGICVDAPEPGASCEGACGGAAADGSCWCDDACEQYGDCCGDYDAACAGDERTVATGQCVKNSFDECTTDADCMGGGCGGELCFNPAVSSGISTCECTAPTAVAGCGCVDGQCSWWN